jgi:hypothetical protein
MKSEVYSWRISSVTKDALEAEARRQRVPIATLLDRITKEWIESDRSGKAAEKEQARLHTAVLKTVGTIAGKNARRSTQARQLIRQRLKRRHGR